MPRNKRKQERNILGMVKVVEMLAYDEGLRRGFLDDPGETLGDLGVEIKDKKLLKNLSEEIKYLIEKEILVAGEGYDPIGPVADVSVGAAVAVGVVTGVSTGAAVAVANVTTSDFETPGDPWRKVTVDFGRISMLEKNALNERRIRILQKQLDRKIMRELKPR